MTYLTDLIDGASGDEVALAVLLRQAKVLASRLRVPALGDWADQELNGYPSMDGLPGYRGPFTAEAYGHLTGPYGYRMENAIIPPRALPEKMRELFVIAFVQGVSELEHLMTGDPEQLATRWPADLLVLINNMRKSGQLNLYNSMLSLVEVRMPISPAHVRGVLDAVRARLLDLALSLEQADTSEGEATTPVVPADQAAVMFYTVIYGGSPTINMSPAGILDGAGYKPPRTEDELLAALKDVGVSDELREELRVALRDDATEATAVPTSPGSRTRRWLAKAVRVSTIGAGQVATNAGGGIIASLVMALFQHH